MNKLKAIVLIVTMMMSFAPFSNIPVLASDSVEIGVNLPLTGPIALAGKDCLNCIELAVEEINRVGGVMGKPLKLIVEDNESRPKSAVEAAHKLADVHKVPVVLGGYSSGNAVPVGKYLNSTNTVYACVATTNQMKSIGPYIFDFADLADQAVVLVDFAWKDVGARKFATLTMNNPIGQDQANETEKRVEQLGGEIVAKILYEVGGKDFRADLMKLMASKPDAILTNIYEGDAIIMQKQLYELGVRDFSKFYSYTLSAMTVVPDPKLIEGMKGASYTTGGPRAPAFQERYKEKYGKEVRNAWAPPFYDATWIMANAINMANSVNAKDIRNAMWPAAYIYQGVSAGGDKGFNMYGMQPLDVTQKLVIRDGKVEPYIEEGGSTDLLSYRYPGKEGVTLQFAPPEEEFADIYPDYKR